MNCNSAERVHNKTNATTVIIIAVHSRNKRRKTYDESWKKTLVTDGRKYAPRSVSPRVKQIEAGWHAYKDGWIRPKKHAFPTCEFDAPAQFFRNI